MIWMNIKGNVLTLMLWRICCGFLFQLTVAYKPNYWSMYRHGSARFARQLPQTVPAWRPCPFQCMSLSPREPIIIIMVIWASSESIMLEARLPNFRIIWSAHVNRAASVWSFDAYACATSHRTPFPVLCTLHFDFYWFFITCSNRPSAIALSRPFDLKLGLFSHMNLFSVKMICTRRGLWQPHNMAIDKNG